MDTGIQANFKIGDTLVNVYGPNGPEFDANLAHVSARADQISAAERALRGEPNGVELIQQELGGQVVADYPTPPPAPPQWTPQPAAYQPQPVQMAAPIAQPVPLVNTYCQRCQQAPVCSTCSQPANPIPKSVKNGQYHIHECPTGDRAHKGQWCNPPKS